MSEISTNSTPVDILDTAVPGKEESGHVSGLAGTEREFTQHEQDEEALRRSEERFRIVAETANDVVYEWDLEQGLEWMGDIDGLLGYEPGEFPGTLDGWAEAVHPDDLDRTMTALRAHLEGGAPFAFDYRIRRKDGIYRWWSARGAAARTPDGRPTRVIGSITDITERKQAEAALSTSEAEFRVLAEAMPQILWVTRPDGWHTHFNQRWIDYTGLTLEESLGHGWLPPFHPEDQPLAAKRWKHANDTGEPYEIEYRLRGADGNYRWMLGRAVPLRDAAGVIVKWFGTCTDVHDLKAAELEISRANRELRESDERFQQLADNITDVFWITSPDFDTLHYISAGYERIWGCPPEDLYANPQQRVEAILPEDRVQALAAFALIRAEAPEMAVEYRIARTDGSTRWIHDRGFQVRDAEGKLVRLAGIARDITERKRAESELQKTHAELVNASRLAGMSEVATSVLHNVGNVLNSVNISCTVASDRVRQSRIASVAKTAALLQAHEDDLAGFLTMDPTGKRLPEYIGKLAEHLTAEQAEVLRELKSLANNIDHIKGIVAKQQNYAKVSGVKEPVRLAEVVEESLGMYEDSLARHGVRVIREYDDVPPITIEKHKALQILVNLIRNAKHACRDSGRDDKLMNLRVTAGSGCVRVSVIDNGVGIPPWNLTRIFAYGFTTKAEGHGFGLHSCALAASEMGGSLTAHSDGAGTGATFTLELPCPE